MLSPSPSLPGTPMSSISTTAIKDGHEGHAQHHRTEGKERRQRLEYFDMIRREEEADQQRETSTEEMDEDARKRAIEEVKKEVKDARGVNGISNDSGVVDTTAVKVEEVGVER
jgi:membrane protein involved in colicin uptake